MLSQLEQFRLNRDEMLPSFQSVRLGATTNPFDTNSFTAVQALPRELLQDFTAPEGSYSSYGFDLNPLDIAYRGDSKEDYAIDFGSLLARTVFAYATGGAAPAAKASATAVIGVFF